MERKRFCCLRHYWDVHFVIVGDFRRHRHGRSKLLRQQPNIYPVSNSLAACPSITSLLWKQDIAQRLAESVLRNPITS